MEVVEDNEGNRTVYIDDNELCVYCEKRFGCPLIECLSSGLVTATEPINVLDCAHFEHLMDNN